MILCFKTCLELQIIDRFVYFAAKLDGVSSQAIKRMADAHHSSINEWLEIDSTDTKDTGKKRVCYIEIKTFLFHYRVKFLHIRFENSQM